MRKDPAERYPDLEQMGGELEEIRRGLIEKAHGVRARVREQRGRLVALHSMLEGLVGRAGDDEAIPILDERGRLATMQALERDLGKRIDDVQAKIARADAPGAGASTWPRPVGRRRALGRGHGVRGDRGGHAGARACRRGPRSRRRRVSVKNAGGSSSPSSWGMREPRWPMAPTPFVWRFSSKRQRFHRPRTLRWRSQRCARRRKRH